MAQESSSSPQESTANDAPSARLGLEFETFSSFVEQYSGYLSLQGMFVKTRRLVPVGSVVAFELKLADGFQICRGTGEVAWIRPADGGPGQPMGLGLRFRSLDEKGRELVHKIFEEQVKEGGTPFEIDRPPPGAIADEALSRQALDDEDATLFHPQATAPATPAEAPAEGGDEEDFSPPWEALPDLPSGVLQGAGEEASPPAPPSADDEGESVQTSLFEETGTDLELEGVDFSAFEGTLEADDTVAQPEAAAAPSLEDELDDIDFDVLPETEDTEPEVPGTGEEEAAELEALAAAPPPSVPAPSAAPMPASEPEAPSGGAELYDPFDEISSEIELPQPVSAAEQAMSSPGFRAEDGDEAGTASRSFLDDDFDRDLGESEEGDWLEPPPRRGLASWWPQILTVVLVLGVLGGVWFFRAQILGLLGIAPPPESQRPPATAGTPPRPVPPPPEPAPTAGEIPIEVVEEPAAEPSAGTPGPSPPTPSPPVPSPRAETPPPARAAETPVGTPARRVTSISWQSAGGATRVEIRFDGGFGEARHRHSRLGSGNPRELIVLQGIVEPYVQGQVEIGSAEVSRIRTGHHPGDELHVVIDLASADARLEEIQARGDRLELRIAK